MALTPDQFKTIRDMVYGECGMFFADSKVYFVDTRIQSRLQAMNCSEVKDYIDFLKFDKSKAELETLVDCLTTNETYFFREVNQLETMILTCLPELMKKKAEKGQRNIRIWSAGCSTGEEPYTIAMMIRENVKDLAAWNVQVMATDISLRVLSACRQGVYPVRSLKDTPPAYADKYFTKEGNSYKISPEIKKMVQFNHLNLFNRGLMRQMDRIDFIFCRNVLVYFDKESAKKVVSSFYDSLNPGGLVFLGFSETMHQFSGAFKTVKFEKAFGYQKE